MDVARFTQGRVWCSVPAFFRAASGNWIPNPPLCETRDGLKNTWPPEPRFGVSELRCSYSTSVNESRNAVDAGAFAYSWVPFTTTW
jgi:hypothetical protein